MSTAGIIVIGNEVLSGKVEEENARYLIRELRTLGVGVFRMVVLRDDIDAIAREVAEMSARYDHVFTSGGVGATHDDVTLFGIAKAFGVPLETDPELLRLLERHYGDRLNSTLRRMAEVPQGSFLLGKDSLPFPIVVMRNVYILPGVPAFFRAKFEVLRPSLQATPILLRQMFVRVGEDAIAPALYEVASRFPDVEIGAYPRFDTEEFRVKITLEGRDPARLERAFVDLLERMSAEWIVRVE